MTGYMIVAVVFFEERNLIEYFGRQYEDYRRRVPMFVPRWKTMFARQREIDGGTASKDVDTPARRLEPEVQAANL